MTRAKHSSDLADYVLADSVDQTLVVGPVLTRPEVGWYFIIASAGAEGFRCDQLVAPRGRAEAETRRVEVIAVTAARTSDLFAGGRTGDGAPV
jgi:hypothetical protein